MLERLNTIKCTPDILCSLLQTYLKAAGHSVVEYVNPNQDMIPVTVQGSWHVAKFNLDAFFEQDKKSRKLYIRKGPYNVRGDLSRVSEILFPVEEIRVTYGDYYELVNKLSSNILASLMPVYNFAALIVEADKGAMLPAKIHQRSYVKDNGKGLGATFAAISDVKEDYGDMFRKAHAPEHEGPHLGAGLKIYPICLKLAME